MVFITAPQLIQRLTPNTSDIDTTIIVAVQFLMLCDNHTLLTNIMGSTAQFTQMCAAFFMVIIISDVLLIFYCDNPCTIIIFVILITVKL